MAVSVKKTVTKIPCKGYGWWVDFQFLHLLLHSPRHPQAFIVWGEVERESMYLGRLVGEVSGSAQHVEGPDFPCLSPSRTTPIAFLSPSTGNMVSRAKNPLKLVWTSHRPPWTCDSCNSIEISETRGLDDASWLTKVAGGKGPSLPCLIQLLQTHALANTFCSQA